MAATVANREREIEGGREKKTKIPYLNIYYAVTVRWTLVVVVRV